MIASTQQSFFPNLTAQFPSTRYQGSKVKLVDWIWEQIADLDFSTCLDAFGGTGAVAYRLKQEGKTTTYNDILRFNYQFGLALIENSEGRLSPEEIDWLLTRHKEISYPNFVQETFQDVYFTDDENKWIDQTIANIRQLPNPYKFALAFFALCQACIIKRPYNLFHRKNLYVRFADVERSFGNKTTWDTSFEQWFRTFAGEANNAVFDNGQMNKSLCADILTMEGNYDLVYIDPPYISSQGVGVDYGEFYHFLEGLTLYDEWNKHVDFKSKHRRLKRRASEWTNKQLIGSAFEKVFQKFENSVIVVSYRSDGIPSIEELITLLRKYKQKVCVEQYGQYKYALSVNEETLEMLLIGE
jgi:adenine-specific DNA methylase